MSAHLRPPLSWSNAAAGCRLARAWTPASRANRVRTHPRTDVTCLIGRWCTHREPLEPGPGRDLAAAAQDSLTSGHAGPDWCHGAWSYHEHQSPAGVVAVRRNTATIHRLDAEVIAAADAALTAVAGAGGTRRRGDMRPGVRGFGSRGAGLTCRAADSWCGDGTGRSCSRES